MFHVFDSSSSLSESSNCCIFMDHATSKEAEAADGCSSAFTSHLRSMSREKEGAKGSSWATISSSTPKSSTNVFTYLASWYCEKAFSSSLSGCTLTGSNSSSLSSTLAPRGQFPPRFVSFFLFWSATGPLRKSLQRLNISLLTVTFRRSRSCSSVSPLIAKQFTIFSR